jgi:hypothetical protein
MKPGESGRIVRSYTQRIEARAETVFPLLCPVREGEWLEGWNDQVEMVHSDSGVAEEGCVFRTRVPGRPETIWTVTRHDPVERVVEFFRLTTFRHDMAWWEDSMNHWLRSGRILRAAGARA